MWGDFSLTSTISHLPVVLVLRTCLSYIQTEVSHCLHLVDFSSVSALEHQLFSEVCAKNKGFESSLSSVLHGSDKLLFMCGESAIKKKNLRERKWLSYDRPYTSPS